MKKKLVLSSPVHPPASHELDVGKGLGETDDFDLWISLLVLDHELPPQGPLVGGLVGALVLVDVPVAHSVNFLDNFWKKSKSSRFFFRKVRICCCEN